MNTKIVKLDDDTRRVMRMCSVEQTGSYWTLDLPQLDRKDYEKAKKALTALGCIWNRKAGTHICDDDPTASITGIANGENIVVEQYDSFYSPLPLVDRMIKEARIEPGMICLEPSAGDGRIADAMWEIVKQAGPRGNVLCCEINPAAQQVLISKGFNIDGTDFLAYNPPLVRFQRIVMNPPFSKEQDILHVQHAWDLLAGGGRVVAIMSEHAWIANNNRCTQFREWLDDVDADVEELPDGTFKESGTMVKARLVVIDKKKRPLPAPQIPANIAHPAQQLTLGLICTSPPFSGETPGFDKPREIGYNES